MNNPVGFVTISLVFKHASERVCNRVNTQTHNRIFFYLGFLVFFFFSPRKPVSKTFTSVIWIIEEPSSSFLLKDLQGCVDRNLSPPECLKLFPPWSPWNQSPSVCSSSSSSHRGSWGQQTHLCTQGTIRRKSNKISQDFGLEHGGMQRSCGREASPGFGQENQHRGVSLWNTQPVPPVFVPRCGFLSPTLEQ